MDSLNRRILIQQIESIPTLPHTLLKIIEALENPSSSASDIGDIIEKDQSLSSIILRLVNSAFYGHLRKVSSIRQATVILGFQTVKSMAMGVSVFDAPSGGGKSGFDRKRFWIHSLGVAAFSQSIFDRLADRKGVERESIFLCGMLHDIGKVVFDNYFNEEYQKVIKIASDENKWIGEVEKIVLGMDHCEAGFHVAQKWQFPYFVVDVIKHHHNPGKISSEGRKVTAIVHLADYCCRKIRLGYGGDEQEVKLNPDAFKILALNKEILEDIMAEMENQKEMIESFILD